MFKHPLLKQVVDFLNTTASNLKQPVEQAIKKETANKPQVFCGSCKGEGCIHCEGHIGKMSLVALKELFFGKPKEEEKTPQAKAKRRKKGLEDLLAEYTKACAEGDTEKADKINKQIAIIVKKNKKESKS